MSEFSRSMTMGNVNERHQQPGNIIVTGDGRIVSQYDAPSFSSNHYDEASSSGNSHYMGAKQLGEKRILSNKEWKFNFQNSVFIFNK